MNRASVFIDGSNFYFALKRNNFMTRVDYYQLSKALVGDANLVRTYYYNSAYDKHLSPEKAKSQLSFLASLDRTPYLELRLGKFVSTSNGMREKGKDLLLASDLVYYAAMDHFDTSIVVAEDSDLAQPLQRVKDLGKRIAVALFPDTQARDLVHVANMLISLEKVLDRHASAIFPAEGESHFERAEAV